MTDPLLVINRGGAEYVRVQLGADKTIQGDVYIAFTTSDQQPAAADWNVAEWVDAPATTRTARVLVRAPGTTGAGKNLTDGMYAIWYRVDSNPQQIVRPTGDYLTVGDLY